MHLLLVKHHRYSMGGEETSYEHYILCCRSQTISPFYRYLPFIQYVIARLGSKFKYNWSGGGDARTLWKGVRRCSTFLSGIMVVLA